jgi:hypothetical protein
MRAKKDRGIMYIIFGPPGRFLPHPRAWRFLEINTAVLNPWLNSDPMAGLGGSFFHDAGTDFFESNVLFGERMFFAGTGQARDSFFVSLILKELFPRHGFVPRSGKP